MRTISHSIREYNDDETGHGFTIIETETRHATTGDEVEVFEYPVWYNTLEEAVAAREALVNYLFGA